MIQQVVPPYSFRVGAHGVLALVLCTLMLFLPPASADSALRPDQRYQPDCGTAGDPEPYQNPDDPPVITGGDTTPLLLELGKEVARELAGGESQTYQIGITAGQYARVVVDQQGIDVVVKVYGPGNSFVCEVDRPTSARGREAVSVIAEVTGLYALRIQPLEKTAARGRYSIRLAEVRDAAPRDESRAAAERAITEGEQLRAQKTATSFPLAICKFEQALALWRALDDAYEEAIALYAIGICYRSIGENQKAFDYFARALPVMRRLGDPYGEAITQTGLAWAYLYLGEEQKALENFSHALYLRRFIEDKRGEALTLHGMGWACALQNDYDKSLEYFSRSLSIRQLIADRQGEALTLIGIGKVCYLTGKKEEALVNLGRALVLLQEIQDRNGEADALSVIGWICNSLGDYKRALDYFNRALPLRRVVGDRAGEATTLFGIAEVERRQGDLLDARNNMEAALSVIESLDTLGTRQELRISYFASVQNYYERYIDLLQSLHRLYPDKGYDATAFNASERARARSLLDILAEIKVDIRRDVDPALLEKQRVLLEQLDLAAERQRQLGGQEPAGEQTARALKRIATLTSEYQEIEGEIRAASPHLAALTHPSPLTVTEIQQQVLDGNTLLLEYALGEKRSYLWAVTQTAVESFQLPGREVIESAARKVFDLITARSDRRAGESPEQKNARVAQADMDYPAAAAALSRIILGPVASRLGSKRLLIVAQGGLSLIPFGALPDLAPGAGQGKPIKPLIFDHEIVYMPSGSTLAVLRRNTSGRTPPPKAIAVLADPVFSKEDERVRSAASGPGVRIEKGEALPEAAEGVENQQAASGGRDVKLIERLPRLFATRWEAEQIASLVPAADRLQALDFNASRDLAMSRDLAQYRIVHFATHAFIDNTHPELSGLVLSLVDRAGRKQDGFLSAREIFNLKLQSDLVVLSGCRTGVGKNVRGEGLIGLARGFMYAGAPRVLVSLWSLNDKATAELMVRFYRKLLGPEGLPPVAALRSAQIEMFKDKRWQSPYSWAAFILEGEWR